MSDYNDAELDILAKVDKFGWMAMNVFDPHGNDPNFTYSIGFPKSLGVPDCIAVGQRPEVTYNMLREVFEQVRGGKQILHDMDWHGLLDGDYVCKSLRIPSQDNVGKFRMSSAIWFWESILKREGPMPAFQIVWPGAITHDYPWDEGCSQEVLDMQPVLGRPNH